MAYGLSEVLRLGKNERRFMNNAQQPWMRRGAAGEADLAHSFLLASMGNL
jgi:hypothetical protein